MSAWGQRVVVIVVARAAKTFGTQLYLGTKIASDNI